MNRPTLPRPATPEPALLPPVDVIEDIAGITLYADLPGVSREQLQLHVDADQLGIEAELSLPAPAGLELSHAEAPLGRYRRTFTLSKELDAERISAELNHGVLQVRIPRATQTEPRRIQIQVR